MGKISARSVTQIPDSEREIAGTDLPIYVAGTLGDVPTGGPIH